MKKRYSISQRKCKQGLVTFYGYVAEMCNIEVTEKSTFDLHEDLCNEACAGSLIRYYSEYRNYQMKKSVQNCFCADLKQIS